MLVRLRSLRERLQHSLFWVPSLYLVAMAVLAQALVTVDARITEGDIDPPVSFTSTVDATRALLATIAGATISFAGIAFSVALLTRQLASSQFTPRLIQQMFRDRFDKRVIGFVVGTFAYCLVVLRAVRAPLEEGGTAVIPNVSVAVAMAFGLLSILAVVAFIDHAAHQMDINQVLSVLTERSLTVVEQQCPERAEGAPGQGTLALAQSVPDGPGHEVRVGGAGWIEVIDHARLLQALPPQGTAVVWFATGQFAAAGVVMATIWSGEEPAVDDEVERAVEGAVVRNDRRTFDLDFTYGLRQIVDVALRAMSPGINDPTTAHEAIQRGTTVLAAILERDLPPVEHRGGDGRRVLLGAQPTYADLVALAYDELRAAAAGNPTVSGYLLEAIADGVAALEAEGLGERADLLRRQARLIDESADRSEMHPDDLASVRAAVEHALEGRTVADPLGLLSGRGGPAGP